MLFLDIQEGALSDPNDVEPMPRVSSFATAGALLTSDSTEAAKALERDRAGGIIEDEIDQFLWKQDGKIPRERNEQL